jgi:DNA-binding LytR/AlgR family response regulator
VKTRCLIIEDEPLAAELIADYIQQVPFLQLHGICNDAISALEVLQQHPIDVLFLDLHLPKLRGFDFLRSLPHPVRVIVTTAYHDFAVEGFELNITDYLMKPVEFSRFLSAVNKLQLKTSPEIQAEKTEKRFQFFNVDKKQVKVYHDDIMYIESLKEYVRIHTVDKPIVTKFQMGNLEAELNNPAFIRIHRSYIVAVQKITAYTHTSVELGGISIPIGRSYSEQVLRQLRQVNR